MTMMISKTKLALLGCAGLAALSASAIANHGAHQNLRGSFSGYQHAGAQQLGSYVAPQHHTAQYQGAQEQMSWQERTLIERLRRNGPGTYVVTDTYHPRGQYVQDHAGEHRHDGGQVYVASQYGQPQYAANPSVRTRPEPVQTVAPAPRYAGLFGGLRGLSNPFARSKPRYDSRAAQDFDRRGSFDLGGPVRTSVLNTRDMLDFQENTTGKTLTLLANRATGVLQPNSLYLGGHVQGSLMYQKTSVDGQFPILSRFPFFSERTDDEAGVFAINNAALSFTSTFGDWTTIHLQPEYSETEYPGEQDEFQLRKAFVVFGNLERSPFYAAFGRKTIDFGNFDSYNAFTQNEGQHYFWAVSDQPVAELGYYNNGWKLSASAFSGGRQLRVALADEENNIANYAASIEKEFLLPNQSAFTVGGGYLHDTIYRDNWTAHTFAGRSNGTPPANFISYRNSLVNGFAEYNSPFFDAMVEYTTTTEPWAAAIPQTPDGVPLDQFLIDPTGSTTDRDNISFDENLSVIVAQARIKPIVNGRRMAIAASGSWGNISDDTGSFNARGVPTSFEKNQQHALSVEYPINDFLDIGAEYVYNKGFIPFVGPQLVSNDETEAHAVNVGFKARF